MLVTKEFRQFISFLVLYFSSNGGDCYDFDGKVVLITGAGSGIGASTAMHFAKAGAKLSLVSKSSDNLKNVAKECSLNSRYKPHIIVSDLTIEKNMREVVMKTIKAFSKLDILVNNAGVIERGSITNTSLDEFDKVFNINVRAMFGVTMFAVPHLMKTRGNIINVSSLDGVRPFRNNVPYSMSKAAVDQFTKCLALELGLRHVRVNSVNPGLVDSGARVGEGQKWFQMYVQGSRKYYSQQRIASANDVARAILMLASDRASSTTGMNFPIEGKRKNSELQLQ